MKFHCFEELSNSCIIDPSDFACVAQGCACIHVYQVNRIMMEHDTTDMCHTG